MTTVLKSLITLSILLSGCGSTIDEASSQLTKGEFNAKISVSFLIGKIEPNRGISGDTINLHGEGLTSDLLVSFDKNPLINLIVVSDKLMTFTVPGGTPGIKEIEFLRNNKKITLSFLQMPSGKGEVLVLGGESDEDVCIGQMYYSLTGETDIGTKDCGAKADAGQTSLVPFCSSEGEVGCVTTDNFKSVGTQDLANKILAGQSAAGIEGTYFPDFPDPTLVSSKASVNGVEGKLEFCDSEAAANCITNATFQSVNVSLLDPAKILIGSTIAGITGSAATSGSIACSADGQTDCLTTAQYKSADTLQFGAGDLINTATIAGITGTISQCATDGAMGCISNTSYKAAKVGVDNVSAANILTGKTVAGVSGSATPAPAHCNANGMENCVAKSPYVSADLSNLSAGNIKSGVTIAGQAGDYPSASYQLPGATATADLPSLDSAMALNSYEYWDSNGTRLIGNVASTGNITPSAANQPFGAPGTVYSSGTVLGDPDLVATNILGTANIFGVQGTATAAPANCSSDGAVGCVTVPAFKSVTVAGLSTIIKTGVIVAGQLGTYPSAGNPLNGSTGTPDLPALDTSIVTGNYEYFNSFGGRLTGRVEDAGNRTASTLDQLISSAGIVYSKVNIVGDPDLVPMKIANTVDIFGVTGTAALKPANCASDGAVGCVTVPAFKSVTIVGLAAKVKTGTSVAGVNGSYPSVGNKLTGATTTTDLPALDQNMALGVFEYWDSIGTRLTGTVANAGNKTASTSNQLVAAANTVYSKVNIVGDPDLVPAKIANTVDILGVTGTANLKPANCASDGVVGCVTVSGYKSVTITGLAAKVKNGATVAGENGTYPSAGNKLTGASPVADLPELDQNMALGNFEYWDSIGTRLTGTVANAGDKTASPSDQLVAATGTVYSKVNIVGDADLVATNISNTVDIFGVTGTATLKPADCASDGVVGCVTVTGFRSVTIAGLAENVKNGASVAGETGTYPSAGNLLSGASGTSDLTQATFDSQLSNANTFEYWDAEGSRQQSQGSINLNNLNLRHGVSLFGKTGEIKTKCRNLATIADANASTNTAGLEGYITVGLDVYDTLQGNYNSNIDYSSDNPFAQALDAILCDSTSWEAAGTDSGAAVGFCNEDADDCAYVDLISELWWAEQDDTHPIPSIGIDWEYAVKTCEESTLAGYNDWRLPTQKELMTAYIHGITTLSENANYWTNLSLNFWSATNMNFGTFLPVEAWYINMGRGEGWRIDKLLQINMSAICVRED